MRKASDIIESKKNIQDSVFKNFEIAMEDDAFCALCGKIKTEKKILAKYTTKLQNTVCELKNCKNCKGLSCCKNNVVGYVDFPSVKDDELVFVYTPCKYKKESILNQSKVTFYETPELLRNANFKSIYVDDENRVEVLKYIKEFMKDYPNKKGIYLHGSFGSGKSYIINAVLNELANKGNKCISVYYPTLLRKLKDSFKCGDYSYQQIFTELEMCDVLLLDDIGAESNSEWSRDEILGSLLQSRMDNNKITFFTSNLNIEELTEHLSKVKGSVDKLKARRIVERILELSKVISLISDNRREY